MARVVQVYSLLADNYFHGLDPPSGNCEKIQHHKMETRDARRVSGRGIKGRKWNKTRYTIGQREEVVILVRKAMNIVRCNWDCLKMCSVILNFGFMS